MNGSVQTEKGEQMRLIDADALMQNAEYKGKHDILTAHDVVAAPTVDAVPVVYGRWILRDDDVRCKVCNTKCLRDDIGINILSNYCPYCGARMDGRREDGAICD